MEIYLSIALVCFVVSMYTSIRMMGWPDTKFETFCLFLIFAILSFIWIAVLFILCCHLVEKFYKHKKSNKGKQNGI